ncbi:hypothetical protein BJ878DRAFT_492640 [Calycina marina]|uniref:CCHC-type domain-containing protein n=1 Tax=Calycina marina TaxID=1763456 RepID=A0A9P8CI04_9HELO|nr:hypothetical protein BJ878DRAFT_492640 [Calycina marina]
MGRGSSSYTTAVTYQSSRDTMDWEPSQGTTIAATGRTEQSRRQQAEWVDYNEIGRRKSEGSCLRCGAQGHVIVDCSLLPARNPNDQRQQISEGSRPEHFTQNYQVVATSAPKKMTAPETPATVIEEYESNYESGKD